MSLVLPRAAAATAVVVAAAVLLTGCQAAHNLDQQYVSAHFVLGTTLRERARVAQACAAPNVVPQALPTSESDPVAKLDLVRFRVDAATPQQLARLYTCLRKFPDVTTVGAPAGP